MRRESARFFRAMMHHVAAHVRVMRAGDWAGGENSGDRDEQHVRVLGRHDIDHQRLVRDGCVHLAEHVAGFACPDHANVAPCVDGLDAHPAR